MISFLKPLLAFFASLKLTVALMAMAMVLIFLGTLAQARIGVWEAMDTYFRSTIAWVDPHLLIPRELVHIPWQLPFPGGLLLGVLVTINLLAAHIRRFSLRGGKAGVLILHAGLLLLLAGEFVTTFWAREGLLSIDVGDSSRVVEDLRRVELAVIDPRNPDHDRVITIPQARLQQARRHQQAISDPALPFTIRILSWQEHAELIVDNAAEESMRGVGSEAAIQALDPVRGVDGAQSNAPAAVVAIEQQGELIGQWLLWVNLIDAQEVPQDNRDHNYAISLRYAREYLPYTLHLEEFRHDQFTGTQVAKNFSSRVRIDDPAHNVEREVLISMNDPLRYRGATFYQASYKPDNSGSVLQVVHNPGAALPYIACLLVAAGMAWHFALGLWSFAQRRKRSLNKATIDQPAPAAPGLLHRAVPWLAGAVAIAIALAGLMRPHRQVNMPYSKWPSGQPAPAAGSNPWIR